MSAPVSSQTNNACTICLEEMTKGTGRATTCSHLFHEACLQKWFVEKNICPTCRTDQSPLQSRTVVPLSSLMEFERAIAALEEMMQLQDIPAYPHHTLLWHERLTDPTLSSPFDSYILHHDSHASTRSLPRRPMAPSPVETEEVRPIPPEGHLILASGRSIPEITRAPRLGEEELERIIGQLSALHAEPD